MPDDDLETRAVDAALDRHRRDRTRLVEILREIQDDLRWLSPDTLTAVAAGLGVSRADVEATATFYAFFATRPRGRTRILFSDNVTDRMAGNRALYRRMLAQFGLSGDETSADGRVSVGLTACTGMGDQGPAILVDGRVVTRMTADRVDAVADLVRRDVALADWPEEFFRVDDQVRRADVLLGGPWVPGESLSAAIARGRDGMLAEMRASNLRGRGGAGFTTAVKWMAARDAAGGPKVIVCNADEGEPGTFKDRVLLASHAGKVFEGMAVAAWCVGASEGFLYLRGEYLHLKAPLEAVLADMRARGLLGRSVLGTEGFDFDVEIRMGAGAYVCGEETALIESLEGKPGRPRIRPPFPVVRGYLGRPTVVNNVETLCKAHEIAKRGGAWFAGTGTRQSTGTKLLSISGDCDRPGVYEYPFGVAIAEVLADCGAERAIAVQVGGASGVLVAADDFRRRIAFEDVPTAGAMMVFGPGRDLVDVAAAFADFFAEESCGFCTPCRVGTRLVKRLVDKVAAGHGTHGDLLEIRRLQSLMARTSHCGLGQTAANAVVDALERFRPAFERRLAAVDFEPAFDLDASLATARRLAGRDDADAHLVQEFEP
ncbi:NAD(P)H-dependent oxidoreductase subunit E [Oharaeibacter diazotrophicus]|uniref:NAD(P)-dependent nickel-iron dehydrogenase flavin-containing subunit n=1 Tax=Oharaeibacter diazotrophicus TaxID=1920512 RepID=A0A4R6R6V0_9HYPH|nr:NAD(P)H-dependent oxidoreductase subunit E [Oharaeibacter diazotrophicus]TDP81534.1 NAD(P)-dependent nickel-iron dehydrogenase flavin-containing subunit [Oharaeibacter diazotrophicus]BBE73772.1 NAD-reducing hydrogenase HoxS subunit alpha [Pleomorphomonas sp. SM30]GLS75563.1 hypothetical protein GCM10007904_08980 [Oharaeibacter diazotrophicus]